MNIILRFLKKLLRYFRQMVKSWHGKKNSPDYFLTKHLERIVRVVKYMAETGRGTDECLKEGCLPVQVHFYSPIPDINDLEKRKIWDKTSQLKGIDFNIAGQVSLLNELGRKFAKECNWPTEKTDNPTEFYVNNTSFSYGCAASLYSIIRYNKPQRIIEIGSGNSSLVISQSITGNSLENYANCDYTIIDPYPGKIVKEKSLPNLNKLITERVELVEPSVFDCLEANDILFIDSSHSVKIGSDVNYLILEVLPRLAPGVIVHFHDIHLPYEYHKAYSTNPGFRVFWTEAYLLQAFLSQNEKFEILLAMNYLMVDRIKDFQEAFPLYDNNKHSAISGSFWIRRKSLN